MEHLVTRPQGFGLEFRSGARTAATAKPGPFHQRPPGPHRLRNAAAEFRRSGIVRTTYPGPRTAGKPQRSETQVAGGGPGGPHREIAWDYRHQRTI